MSGKPDEILSPAQVKALRQAVGLCGQCRQRLEFLRQIGVDVDAMERQVDATERRSIGALTLFEQQQIGGPR